MIAALIFVAVVIVWGCVGVKYVARAMYVPDDKTLTPNPRTLRGAFAVRQDGRFVGLMFVWPVLAFRQRRAARALHRREQETLAAIKRGER